MADLLMVFLLLAAFAGTAAYVRVCQNLTHKPPA